MQNLKLISILFALLLNAPAAFSAEPVFSIGYCVGAGCYSGSPNYTGPFDNYNVAGGGGDRMRREAYEAYRYGKLREFERYSQELQQHLVEYQVQQQNAQNDAQKIEEIKIEMQNLVQAEYPVPPQEVLDSESRRLVNPVPLNTTEENLQKNLDGVWDEVKKSQPVKTVDEIKKLNDRIHPIPGTNVSDLPAAEGQYLQSEMRLSGLVNEQGFARLPYAQTPNAPMYTSASTFEGADLRYAMNQTLAAQSVVGAVCSGGEAGADCARAQVALNEQVATIYALDRMIANQGLASPAVYELFQETKALAAFSAGVATGIVDGAINTVTGLAQLVAHPIASIQAMGTAIANYEQTGAMIKDAFLKRYDQLVNGSAEERGHVIGEAIWEIGSLLVPVGEIAKIPEAAALLKASTFEAAAQVIGRTEKFTGVLSAAEVRAQLIASRFEMKGAELSEFVEWGTKRLDIGDKGELAISFAKGVSRERYDVLRGVQKGLTDVSEEAQTYITRQVTYESTIRRGGEIASGELETMARNYDKFDNAMSGVVAKKAPAEGYTVTRGISKTYEDYTGKVITNTEENVFQPHRVGEFRSDRFSQPGQSAIYTSMGPEAVKTIELETRKAASDLVFGTETFHPEKVLDLTDETVVSQMRTTIKEITLKSDDDLAAYAQTQIIGDLAKKYGYDAILTYSAENTKTINLILLK